MMAKTFVTNNNTIYIYIYIYIYYDEKNICQTHEKYRHEFSLKKMTISAPIVKGTLNTLLHTIMSFYTTCWGDKTLGRF